MKLRIPFFGRHNGECLIIVKSAREKVIEEKENKLDELLRTREDTIKRLYSFYEQTKEQQSKI